MRRNGRRSLYTGGILMVLFAVWTVLITVIDVQPVGQQGTEVGFAALNTRFHELTGVHMWIYEVTDVLELLAIAVCVFFAFVGLVQLIRRKSIAKVDHDILFLGAYYLTVIFAYLFFNAVPLNYRPVLIEGELEPSYPSSTTLLLISVMLALMNQAQRRLKDTAGFAVSIAAAVFMVLIVVGRTVCGVHWLTDIVGAVLLSTGLFMIYKGLVTYVDWKKRKKRKEKSAIRNMRAD